MYVHDANFGLKINVDDHLFFPRLTDNLTINFDFPVIKQRIEHEFLNFV